MSNLYLIMCKTKTEGKEGISCFLVPKDTKGLAFGANEKLVLDNNDHDVILSDEMRIKKNI
jgi:alkylation response protein AidB-like acyl-CoA dehydrogenase